MKKKKLSRSILLVMAAIIITHIFIVWETPFALAEDGREASAGQLDLRDKVLKVDGPFELNGEWEFYWKQLLTPEDVKRGRLLSAPHMVTVPNTWRHYDTEEGDSLPKYGYATYHLTLLLDEAALGQPVSLYMPSVATAYRLWVNEKLVGDNGRVGETRQQMIPVNLPRIVTFTADKPQIDLLLQVSNFHQRKAGLWEAITFGTVEQITALRERNILFQAGVIGCILIIGVYHLVMFLQRPKALSPLYLAISCFGVALRTSLLKDTLLIYLFPRMSWEVAVSLEYLAALIALLCFLLFVRRELFLDMSRRLIHAFTIIIVMYCSFVIVAPARIFTDTFQFYRILIVAVMLSIVTVAFISFIRKREGAKLQLMALLILFTAILNDLFYYSQWISTDEFVSVGLLFYLFVQAIHLARRVARSFHNVERLSGELQMLNHSLEQKVEQRTEALREANNSLQKVEKSRRRLLASVSHELNTPLTFIQGYIKAMIDGVVPKDDSSYLRAVYGDTQMMAHIINDLQELSKLEAGQVRFQYEYIQIHSFFRQLYEEQKPVIDEKGFHFRLEEQWHDDVVDVSSFICLIDPVRIKQVYMNLLINAQKFTPQGGTIIVKLEVPSAETPTEIKVSVADTGAGIAEQELPYIFDRFYKINGAIGKHQGAGLGLAIVKEIIVYHQGSVGVDSKQGSGSVFFFTLPIVKDTRKRGGTGQ